MNKAFERLNAYMRKFLFYLACIKREGFWDWRLTYRKAKLLNHWIQRYDVNRMKWVLNYIQETLGGHNSFSQQQSVDRDNNPIPWYTFPAIEYIQQLDLSKFCVFEYGSGNSSTFWASRTAFVTSVESDPGWYDLVSQKLSSNQRLLLKVDNKDYVNSIHLDLTLYDIIIVDGLCRHNCAIEAVKKIKNGGFIILDNADWHPKAARFLRESGFSEIDFIGASPINSYALCTSFFFKGSLMVSRSSNFEAVRVLGGIAQIAESDELL